MIGKPEALTPALGVLESTPSLPPIEGWQEKCRERLLSSSELIHYDAQPPEQLLCILGRGG
jgi:hypothetical protein